MEKSKKKVVAIIMARMGSTRFPGKVLAKLGGKTILEHQINRLRKSKEIDEIVVATTNLPSGENLPIVKLAQKLGVGISYEKATSALEEFVLAARAHNADIIVRITVDCALLFTEAMDRLIKNVKNNEAEYSHNRHKRGVPLGMHAEVITREAIERVFSLANEKKHKEHITLYILENPSKFKIKNFAENPSFQKPNIVLSIDRPEELEKIKKIFLALGEDVDDSKKVIKYASEHPEFYEEDINYHMNFMDIIHGEP
ncbi:3-deoxy-manno-octulosonate cytidylyltransferase [uncultured archaeon]|nr:3-deoxy-manno-octulosonate cytidylyltransferase [uncultured archaeon]